MISTMRNLTNHGSTVGAMLASPVVGRIKPCEVYALFESITPCGDASVAPCMFNRGGIVNGERPEVE